MSLFAFTMMLAISKHTTTKAISKGGDIYLRNREIPRSVANIAVVRTFALDYRPCTRNPRTITAHSVLGAAFAVARKRDRKPHRDAKDIEENA